MNIKMKGGGEGGGNCRHCCRACSDGGATRQSPSRRGGGQLGPIRRHPPRRPDEHIRRRLAAGPPVGRIERRRDRDGAASAVPARAVGRVIIPVIVVDLHPLVRRRCRR